MRRKRRTFPGVLSIESEPFISEHRCWLIASPSPVPPNFREVLLSACTNGCRMSCCAEGSIPMPVSIILKEILIFPEVSGAYVAFK